MDIDLQNPEFKLSSHSNDKILDENEILSVLEGNCSLSNEFKNNGIVSSKQYKFITKANFTSDKISEVLKQNKTEEEMEQSKRNLAAVQNYWNELFGHNYHIDFAHRCDDECAIYDESRFTYDSLQERLREIFL